MNLFIKKTGISLIVLVITIIVIIILASAVILSLSNNNSIVAANEAQFKQNIDDYKSELSLYELSMYSEDKGGVNITTINATSSTDPSIKKIISSMKDDDTLRFVIEKGELVYLNNLSSDEKIWAQELGLKPSEGGGPYEQANSAVNEGTAGTSIANNSTINGQAPSYNNPVIPAGFFAVNTTVASWNNVSTDWNNGLVIQDNYGNQFV